MTWGFHVRGGEEVEGGGERQEGGRVREVGRGCMGGEKRGRGEGASDGGRATAAEDGGGAGGEEMFSPSHVISRDPSSMEEEGEEEEEDGGVVESLQRAEGSRQHDQLVVFILRSTLFEEAFPLIIYLTTSLEIWTSLARAYVSPSNTRILQLHEALHEHKQWDLSVTVYLYIAKNISDSLVVAGRLISAADLNVYIFKGLCPEFRDLSMTLNPRLEAVSLEDLHALLLSHYYIHGCPVVEAISPMAHLTGAQILTAGLLPAGNISCDLQTVGQ
ncbi:uncharacterized protein A4U43_C10F4930 [Asparagus officinalis]|uniref:Uncharacterized protein n=1 Tax=Asparagus officinalis TaxID=4686 RepID=A0A5P1E3V8_ASPOF|nr:uncharacterized protein A4U43_C10F4930 [Asparagus officinalis]